MRRLRTPGGVCVCVLALLASACSTAPPSADPSDNEVWASEPPTNVDGVERSGPWELTISHELVEAGPSILLAAPARASFVQISTEPTFSNARWTPIDPAVSFVSPSTGVQELFVRYQDVEGETMPDTMTAGFTLVGPTRPITELTRAAERIRVSRVAPDVLQLDLRIGEVIYGDDGRGFASGPDIAPNNWLDDRPRVEVVDGATTLDVAEVSLLSKPTGHIDAKTFSLQHRIHIRTSDPIPNGTLELSLAGVPSPVSVTLSDESYTPAIRVNHLGYAATDQGKTAHYSVWSDLSSPIDPSGLDGYLLDENGTRVADVSAVTYVGDDRSELWRGDLTGAPTTSFDLSVLQEPGSYRLCIGRVGCSERFEISVGGPWLGLSATVSRALFHQRSGLQLEQPYTAFERPRPYHPDDGLIPEASTQTLFEDHNRNAQGEPFVNLIAGRTGEPVPDAWGGHFDAGDWDRRIQHLWMVRRLVDLVDEFGDTGIVSDLNIPESGDDVPDLLDEAAWSLDLYRRLQTADGGIRGGIEAADHPVEGSVSWDEPLDVFVYAPDPWSSYVYAGVAADMAFVLERYDTDRAAEYRSSAIAAATWADEQLATNPSDDGDLVNQRAIAAVSLYRLTQDDAWHDAFKAVSPLVEGINPEPCILASSCEASWKYTRLASDLQDPTIARNAKDSIVSVADELLVTAETTAFGWSLEAPNVPIIWGLGPSVPHGVTTMRAYLLTGDDRYREQVVRNASFALGDNPAGLSYLTGVGSENPLGPLMVDQQNSDLRVWPGVPVYGIFRSWELPSWYNDFYLGRAGTTPVATQWPTLHSFIDLGVFAGHSEFTIHQNHGEAIWTFASLAATS